MFYRIMTLLTLGAATVPSIYSSSLAAPFDSLLTPDVTTEIVKAIADKAEGFIAKISLSGKEWNMFKHRDEVESNIRMDINVELSRMQSASNLGNGTYTFLMRQPSQNRYVYRVIKFEVSGARIDFKEQLGLVEFIHTSDEHVHQSRVHESDEHIHQTRIHESDEHIHQNRVHESGEHVHQNRVHEPGERIPQGRVHEAGEQIHQSRVHESTEQAHTHNYNPLNQPHGLVAPSTAPTLSTHLATLFSKE